MLTRDLETMGRQARSLAGSPVVAVDTETSGLDPLVDALLLVSFSNGAQVLTCDVRGHPPEAVAQQLGPLLQGGPLKVFHNAKFDLRMMARLTTDIWPVADTWLTEQVLENGRRDSGFGLADLSVRYLGVPMSKEERLSFTRLGEGAITAAQQEYAARDVLVTYQVFLQQVRRLSPEGARKVARLESLAVRAFADMEQRGLFVDAQAWAEQIGAAEREREAAREALLTQLKPVLDTDLFGTVVINLESEAEVRAAFNRLGLKDLPLRQSVLRGLGHPAAEALVAYREAHKLVGTYGEGFLSHIHPRTGRIHANFRQMGASTGRVSCERPNLQNIPKDSALRACFRAPPGRALVTADYAACELRILTHLSADPVFLGAFERGEDVHAKVASQIWGVPVSKTQHPELRERAKAISFGLIYGMGAAGLAAQTGQDLSEAEALLGRYFQQFPRIDAALRSLEQQARAHHHAQTVLGRRLYMDPEWWERDRGAALRLSRNMPIQGTSADITKLAMAFIHDRLAAVDASLVNTVHDELLVECAAAASESVAVAVKEEMERAMALVVPGVPPRAEVTVGQTWAKG